MRAFPLMLIVVLAYNVLVFGSGVTGQQDVPALLGQGFTLTMFSGDPWKITLSDAFLGGALVLLFWEVVKATRTSQREIVNHALSMLTFAGAMGEFITLRGFGTSTFALIAFMCLFDVVAGYTISILAARRDLSVTPHDEP
jgi:hypothetical protein